MQMQMSIDQKFVAECHKILPAMVAENPNHTDQAGTVFFEFVKQILTPEKAPKITGMLIDLPLQDIKQMMQDWNLFQTRVRQADEVLSRPRQ